MPSRQVRRRLAPLHLSRVMAPKTTGHRVQKSSAAVGQNEEDVSFCPGMRSWNEIISRNAKLALEAARERHREATGKNLSDLAVAKRMSRLMKVRGQVGDASVEACRKGFQRPLRAPKDSFWRSDYLDAFARAVGAPPERLVALDYTEGKITDANYGQWLFQAIGGELTPKQARGLADRIQRTNEVPGMHDLMGELIEACLSAENQTEASVAVLGIIQSKDIWAKKKATPAESKNLSK